MSDIDETPKDGEGGAKESERVVVANQDPDREKSSSSSSSSGGRDLLPPPLPLSSPLDPDPKIRIQHYASTAFEDTSRPFGASDSIASLGNAYGDSPGVQAGLVARGRNRIIGPGPLGANATARQEEERGFQQSRRQALAAETAEEKADRQGKGKFVAQASQASTAQQRDVAGVRRGGGAGKVGYNKWEGRESREKKASIEARAGILNYGDDLSFTPPRDSVSGGKANMESSHPRRSPVPTSPPSAHIEDSGVYSHSNHTVAESGVQVTDFQEQTRGGSKQDTILVNQATSRDSADVGMHDDTIKHSGSEQSHSTLIEPDISPIDLATPKNVDSVERNSSGESPIPAVALTNNTLSSIMKSPARLTSNSHTSFQPGGQPQSDNYPPEPVISDGRADHLDVPVRMLREDHWDAELDAKLCHWQDGSLFMVYLAVYEKKGGMLPQMLNELGALLEGDNVATAADLSPHFAAALGIDGCVWQRLVRGYLLYDEQRDRFSQSTDVTFLPRHRYTIEEACQIVENYQYLRPIWIDRILRHRARRIGLLELSAEEIEIAEEANASQMARADPNPAEPALPVATPMHTADTHPHASGSEQQNTQEDAGISHESASHNPSPSPSTEGSPTQGGLPTSRSIDSMLMLSKSPVLAGNANQTSTGGVAGRLFGTSQHQAGPSIGNPTTPKSSSTDDPFAATPAGLSASSTPAESNKFPASTSPGSSVQPSPLSSLGNASSQLHPGNLAPVGPALARPAHIHTGPSLSASPGDPSVLAGSPGATYLAAHQMMQAGGTPKTGAGAGAGNNEHGLGGGARQGKAPMHSYGIEHEQARLAGMGMSGFAGRADYTGPPGPMLSVEAPRVTPQGPQVVKRARTSTASSLQKTHKRQRQKSTAQGQGHAEFLPMPPGEGNLAGGEEDMDLEEEEEEEEGIEGAEMLDEGMVDVMNEEGDVEELNADETASTDGIFEVDMTGNSGVDTPGQSQPDTDDAHTPSQVQHANGAQTPGHGQQPGFDEHDQTRTPTQAHPNPSTPVPSSDQINNNDPSTPRPPTPEPPTPNPPSPNPQSPNNPPPPPPQPNGPPPTTAADNAPSRRWKRELRNLEPLMKNLFGGKFGRERPGSSPKKRN